MNAVKLDNEELAIMYVALRSLREKWTGDATYDRLYHKVEEVYDTRFDQEAQTERTDEDDPMSDWTFVRDMRLV